MRQCWFPCFFSYAEYNSSLPFGCVSDRIVENLTDCCYIVGLSPAYRVAFFSFNSHQKLSPKCLTVPLKLQFPLTLDSTKPTKVYGSTACLKSCMKPFVAPVESWIESLESVSSGSED